MLVLKKKKREEEKRERKENYLAQVFFKVFKVQKREVSPQEASK